MYIMYKTRYEYVYVDAMSMFMVFSLSLSSITFFS